MGQDAGVQVSRKATDAGQKLTDFSCTLSKTRTILCRGVSVERAAGGGLVAVQGLHMAYCHLQDVCLLQLAVPAGVLSLGGEDEVLELVEASIDPLPPATLHQGLVASSCFL